MIRWAHGFFALALLAASPVSSATQPEIHWAPVERLDLIDVELINNAETSIDIAAYVLSDWEIIDALNNAQARGVKVRVLLDPREPSAIDRMEGLELRWKDKGPLMHLKAYVIDGTVLRTGSANYSHSGETQQDNDLLVIRDPVIAQAFEARFETIWAAGLNQ